LPQVGQGNDISSSIHAENFFAVRYLPTAKTAPVTHVFITRRYAHAGYEGVFIV